MEGAILRVVGLIFAVKVPHLAPLVVFDDFLLFIFVRGKRESERAREDSSVQYIQILCLSVTFLFYLGAKAFARLSQ